MKFIALDLETTGLDPNTDTIIEVAAISFSIEKDEDGVFRATDQDERTMLINPGRELKEEVTMITGISADMLDGKQRWEDVRERVRSFIGNAVIVGHNVLFDIGMFATHGINLTANAVLDTFELSELFSQDAESLNLGFLGGLYGLSPGEAEHRALGDTRVSVALFLRYLNNLHHLSKTKKSILRLMGGKEKEKSIGILNEIAGIAEGEIFVPHYEVATGNTHGSTESQGEKTERVFSFDGNIETETELILSQIEKYGRVALLTPNKKVQSFLTEILKSSGCNVKMGIAPSRWCSLEEIQSMITNVDTWERKMTIFLGKLLFWLEETETGLLEELNFYGEEREYLRFFHTEEGEYHHFRASYARQIQDASCVVYDTNEFLRNPEQDFVPAMIIKDIPLLEDAMRKMLSIHINIEQIVTDLRAFPETKNLIYTLYLIGDIYENIPDRPKGENPFPPGGFGETYFFSQEKLWDTKGKWLLLFAELLRRYHEEWKNTRKIINRRDLIRVNSIDGAVTALTHYAIYKQENTNVIIHIKDTETTIHLIPRNVSSNIRHSLSDLNTEYITMYGYNITGLLMQRFLKDECGVNMTPMSSAGNSSKIHLLSVESERREMLPGTVILTTSQKHIREMGKNLQKGGNTILMQGISGGKGKMLSLFERNKENSILIGIIDTWKDEFSLWEIAKDIIIAKLPFDPPSDPYFLARTVGMSDNFSLYSEPMAIIRINTLIGRIRNAGYTGNISCMDERLEKTIWGKEIAEEIL